MSFSAINLGHGIGLRPRHYGRFLQGAAPVAWVEAISENFMARGGRPLAVLDKVRRDVPVGLHGVSLAIGSLEPLCADYLSQLRALIGRVEPSLISDHLCWGRHAGRYLHDLLPLPYTEEALEHVVARVTRVQDTLGRQLMLENVSSYVAFRESTIPEWEFLAEVARRADCGILLDVNNVYVNAHNHGFDADAYLNAIPPDRVGQLHLAGHSRSGELLIDTHDHPVPGPVWQLYQRVVRRLGPRPTLIEWDDDVPELDVLIEESRHAARLERRALEPAGAEVTP